MNRTLDELKKTIENTKKALKNNKDEKFKLRFQVSQSNTNTVETSKSTSLNKKTREDVHSPKILPESIVLPVELSKESTERLETEVDDEVREVSPLDQHKMNKKTISNGIIINSKQEEVSNEVNSLKADSLRTEEVSKSEEKEEKSKEIPLVISSKSILDEDNEFCFNDLLIESDQIGGKPKTKLKTLVLSTLMVKHLTKEKSILYQKDQEISKIKEQVKEQRKNLTKLINEKKEQPIVLKGALIKLQSLQQEEKNICLNLKRSLNPPAIKYYFVLNGRYLSYFSTYPSKTPKRMIDLFGSTVKAIKSQKSLTGFEIRLDAIVRTPNKTYRKYYRFAPESAEIAVTWAKAIERNISYVTQEEFKTKTKNKDDEIFLNTSQQTVMTGIDITTITIEPIDTYYDILNVSPSATDFILKKRYRTLAMSFHPDKHKSKSKEKQLKVQKEFASISKAYSTLKDPETRKQYDLTLNVKGGLRLGLLAKIYIYNDYLKELDTSDEQEETLKCEEERVLFVDEKFEFLFWQLSSCGTVLQEGYQAVELRFVQRIFAGENFDDLEEIFDLNRQMNCLVLTGKRKGCEDFIIELENQELRDELLDGLRNIRANASMLFQQNLEKMKAQGFR